MGIENALLVNLGSLKLSDLVGDANYVAKVW